MKLIARGDGVFVAEIGFQEAERLLGALRSGRYRGQGVGIGTEYDLSPLFATAESIGDVNASLRHLRQVADNFDRVLNSDAQNKQPDSPEAK